MNTLDELEKYCNIKRPVGALMLTVSIPILEDHSLR